MDAAIVTSKVEFWPSKTSKIVQTKISFDTRSKIADLATSFELERNFVTFLGQQQSCLQHGNNNLIESRKFKNVCLSGVSAGVSGTVWLI